MYNLLIVDDEPAILEGMQLMLRFSEYGFTNVEYAENGEDALEKAKHTKYHLLMTDIRMPVMDGLELLKEVKLLNPTIKALILSGYNEFSYAKKAIEYGVMGYLLKPINRDELIDHLSNAKKLLDQETEDENMLWQIDWDNQNLLVAVTNRDFLTTELEIDRLIEEITLKPTSEATISMLFQNLIYSLCTLVKRSNGNVDLLFSHQEIQDAISNCMDMEKFKFSLVHIAAKASNCLSELMGKKSTNVIDQILKHVDENYSKEISLKEISSIFYMNAAYLGQLFKNAMGETFSDYLNKRRIAEVKKLMLSKEYKIQEILDKVGYHNHGYFYKKFKLHEGISFAEYNHELKERERQNSRMKMIPSDSNDHR